MKNRTELYRQKKIRTDAIKHIDGLITSDNDFFDNQTPEDTKQFLNMLRVLEQEYGKDNLLYATVHMDEKHHICIMALFQ